MPHLDSRVPPLGRARVPWGPRRQGPTPTDVSSDEESVYVDHQMGATYNFSIIATMEWSISDRRTCIDWWNSRINDAPGILRANGHVHMFILSQLFAFLPTKRRQGWWGLKFINAGEANCLRSWAYVDGQSSGSQCRSVGSPTIWKESWRPCIVVPETGQDFLAYYDADLLWNKSIPWGCNIGRLRKDLHYPPPPPALEDQWEIVD